MTSIPLIGGGEIRDYAHASKVFRTNGFARAGKYKFLYHVNFNLTSGKLSTTSQIDPRDLSYMVKKVELPKFTVENQVMNQYNHKQVIQKKINYNPVTITFHDDNGNQIRELWREYYNYYYADGRYDEGVYRVDDKYQNTRSRNAWGYNPKAGGPFFSSIDIYSLYAGKSFQISLINPTIVSFNHDTHDYADNTGLMEHSMQIAYTSVKYLEGYWAGTPNFADPSAYDTKPSSQTPTTAGQVFDAKSGQLVQPLTSFQDNSIPRVNMENIQNLQQYQALQNAQGKTSLGIIDTSNIINSQNRSSGSYVFPTTSFGMVSPLSDAGIYDVSRPISATSESTALINNHQFLGVYPGGSWQYALEMRGHDQKNISAAETIITAALLAGDIVNSAQAILLAEKYIANPSSTKAKYNTSYFTTPASNYPVSLNKKNAIQPVYNAQDWQQTLQTKGYKDFEIAQAANSLDKVKLAPEVNRQEYAESYIQRLRANKKVK